jgi:hypothetical protein
VEGSFGNAELVPDSALFIFKGVEVFSQPIELRSSQLKFLQLESNSAHSPAYGKHVVLLRGQWMGRVISTTPRN